MDRIEEQAELSTLLDAATTFEASDLAIEQDWAGRVRAMLAGHPTATLDQQRTDLLADMRELLRQAVNDPSIVDTPWFWRRAHRALCQDEGIVKPGEDFIRQYRSMTEDGWGEWRLLPEDGSFKMPKTDTQVRYAAPGMPFDGWQPDQNRPAMTAKMDSLDDVLDQLKRQRRTLLSELQELESGLRRHSEMREGEWADITPELIKAWRDEVQEIERLIDDYEKRNASKARL